MSDPSVLDSEEFHCKICGLIFVDPRVLQCGHTFCLQCVKNSISSNKDKSKFECPACKAIHKFADKKLGPESLTKNIYLENVIAKLQANAQASQNLPFPYNLYSSFANPTPQVQVEENTHQPPPTHDTNSIPSSQQPPQTTFYPSFSQPTSNMSSNAPPSAPPSAPPMEVTDYTDISGSAPLYPTLSAPAYSNQPQNNPPPPLPPKQQQAPPPQPVPQKQVPPPQPVKQTQQPPQQEKGFWSSVASFFIGDSQPSQPKPQAQIIVNYAPFTCDPQQVYGIFKKWCSSWWFAPSDFDKKFQMGPVIPCYIPFWVYSLTSNCQYNAQVLGTFTEPTTNRKFENWTNATGRQTNQYQSLLICGDAEHSTVILELITSLDDWDASLATGLQPYLLPNGQAPPMAKTIDDRTASSRATSTIIEHEKNALISKLKKDYKTEKVEQVQISNLQFTNFSGKLVFLPVFISYFVYEGKDYKFVVSGQTSVLKGQRPYGLGKVGAAMKSGAELVGSVLKRIV